MEGKKGRNKSRSRKGLTRGGEAKNVAWTRRKINREEEEWGKIGPSDPVVQMTLYTWQPKGSRSPGANGKFLGAAHRHRTLPPNKNSRIDKDNSFQQSRTLRNLHQVCPFRRRTLTQPYHILVFFTKVITNLLLPWDCLP